MANLSNTNNKFIVTDGGNGRVLIGATNDIGATLFANHPSTTAPSLTFNAPAGQVFENEDLQIAFGLNNASPYNGYMQTRFVSAPYYRNLAINPLGGNVGIGTNSPAAKLEIKASGSTTGLTFKTTDAAGNENFFIQDGGRTGVRYYPLTVGQASGTAAASGARFQVATTGGDFVVMNDGKTGIGTTLPGEKLEVNGVIQIKRVGDHPAIRFIEDTTTRGYIGTGDWAINGLLDADLGISSASTGSLVLGTNSGNGRVWIVNGGNVGIGGSPTVSFEIAKAGARMKMIDGTNQLNMGLWDGANYRFEGDANRPMFFTSYQGNINFGISGGTTMSVQSGGVTIGATAVPAAKLDVNGALKAQRFFSRNGSFSSTSGNWHNVVDLQQSEYENRTLICSVYTNGTHSYSSATVNVAYNGGNFVITLGNKISGGSTDIRISGAYLQFYTPWTTTGNFWRITIN